MRLPRYKAVVVGLSMGGMQVLKKIIPALPASFPLPIVIAQHIGEDPDSFLARYLGRITRATKARIFCDTLPALNSSQTLLQVLFQNLLGNAMKFQDGSVTPELHIEAKESEDEWLFPTPPWRWLLSGARRRCPPPLASPLRPPRRSPAGRTRRRASRS